MHILQLIIKDFRAIFRLWKAGVPKGTPQSLEKGTAWQLSADRKIMTRAN